MFLPIFSSLILISLVMLSIGSPESARARFFMLMWRQLSVRSFVHMSLYVCLNPGVSSASLLHSKSLRGHRDCFEKCHLIANQKLSHSKVSRSAYEGMKLALSQKLNRIIQFAQNKDALSSNGCTRRGAKVLRFSQQSERKLLPQSDAQVPRYAPCWDRATATGLPEHAKGTLESQMAEEVNLLHDSQSIGWTKDGRKDLLSWKQTSGQMQHRNQGHSRDECKHHATIHVFAFSQCDYRGALDFLVFFFISCSFIE